MITKGPWEFKKDYDNNVDADLEYEGIAGTIRGDDWNIARIWNTSQNHDDDAKAIAAVPDMIEALQHLEGILSEESEENWEMELQHIRYALQKAGIQ